MQEKTKPRVDSSYSQKLPNRCLKIILQTPAKKQRSQVSVVASKNKQDWIDKILKKASLYILGEFKKAGRFVPEIASHVRLTSDFAASKHVKLLNFDTVRPDGAKELDVLASIILRNADKQANVETYIAP